MSVKFSFEGSNLILITILWFFINSEARSQNLTDNVDMSFGIQAYDPVHIKVEEKTGSAFSNPIRFAAFNSTYYPFMLVIDFIKFDNLAPQPPGREIKVSHGANNLFTFSIHVPGIGYGYQYSYTYWLAPSNEIIDEEFPYLIPISEGRKVSSKSTLLGRVHDSFIGEIGDTVYCMRRGLVAAAPRSETIDFRLSKNDCLEVLHDDGTYMIYHYLKKSESFTSPGKIVLPGQPIGTLSDSSYLKVILMKIEKTRNLMIAQPIKYAVGKTGTVSFDEIDGKEKSVHPREIITREMKSRELKMFEKKR